MHSNNVLVTLELQGFITTGKIFSGAIYNYKRTEAINFSLHLPSPISRKGSIKWYEAPAHTDINAELINFVVRQETLCIRFIEVPTAYRTSDYFYRWCLTFNKEKTKLIGERRSFTNNKRSVNIEL